MQKHVSKKVAVAFFMTLMISNPAWANDINARANELAGQQKFDQALALLSQQDSTIAQGYEHRFLKARILSWNGNYSAARTELNALMAQHPNNPDLQLTMGYLEYYQSNLDAAAVQFERVLANHPDYEDARKGLATVREAKAAALRNKRQWRIDGGIGFSDFDIDELPEWNDQRLRVEYTPDTLSYHAAVQRYERFGLNDVQFEAGIADAVRGGWDWGVHAGFTAGAQFRPSFSAGGRVGRTFKQEGDTVFYPTISYDYDDYDTGVIHTIQPELTTYLREGLVITGRLIATLQTAEEDQLGWLVEARKPVTKRFTVRAGYANAPEALDGLAITTESIFGGVTYKVQDDLDLHLNLARDDREDSFVRNSVNVSFTYKR